MTNTNYLEIEVVLGNVFALEAPSSDAKVMPSSLRLHIPDDSKVYTLRNLLLEISLNHEQLAKVLLDQKTGNLKGTTVVLLNGTHVGLLGGLETPIKVGDRLAFLPFIDGG